MLLKEKVERKIWLVVGLFFLIGLSHALGSRCIDCMIYDDYANVYQNQAMYLSKYGFHEFDERVESITTEKAFYFLMWIITKLFEQDYWLAGLSFYSLCFLYVGLLKYFDVKESLVIIALSSVGLSTQLIRQYIGWSFSFMVLAILDRGRLKNTLLFISFWIHHSTVILFLKYMLSRVKLKYIILILVILFLFFDIFLGDLLNIDYYSIDYLKSESPDSDIFNYNRSFIWRALLLIPLILFVNGSFRNYILISVFLFFLILNLPLIPVRFNLLILSHGLGLFAILLIRKIEIGKTTFLSFLMFVILLKIYVPQKSETPLWTTYGILI